MGNAESLPRLRAFVLQQSPKFGVNSLIFPLTQTCKAAVTHTARLHVTMCKELEFPPKQKPFPHPHPGRLMFPKPPGTGCFQHLKVRSDTYRILAWALVLVTSVRYSSFS